MYELNAHERHHKVVNMSGISWYWVRPAQNDSTGIWHSYVRWR